MSIENINKMNPHEITNLLDFISSENSLHDTDENSNWDDEDDDSISEDVPASVMLGDGDDWNNNFTDEQPNSNVIYSPQNEPVGIHDDIVEIMIDCSPFNFLALFFDHEVLKLIVLETNRYANSKTFFLINPLFGL